MSEVFISGFFGMGNLGDDVILRGILDSIREYIPKVRFLVTGQILSHIDKGKNLVAISPDDSEIIYSAIKRASLIICGGGGLIHDLPYSYYLPDFPKGSLGGMFRELYVTLCAKILQKPIMFWGIGVGPMFTPKAKILASIILNNADIITVRDFFSYREILKMKVLKPIFVTADPAFLIKTNEDKERNQVKILLRQIGIPFNKDFIIITGRPHPLKNSTHSQVGEKEKNYIKNLASLCDYIVAHINAIPLFISMQLSKEKDDLLINKVINTMKHQSSAKIISQQLSAEELSGIFKMAKMTVGARLHSIILAALNECPFISFSYHPKVRSIVRMLGQEKYSVDIYDNNVSQLITMIDEIMACINRIRQTLKERVVFLKNQAVLSALLAFQLYKQHRDFREFSLDLVNHKQKLISEKEYHCILERGEGIFKSSALLELYEEENKKLKEENRRLKQKLEKDFLIRIYHYLRKLLKV